ncbi:MAG: 3-deoxy-D-manno-octulosonic acid transferase [Pseudomonadota bacterium]
MTAPIALRAYFFASALAAPAGRMFLKRRLARGKEDPERVDERLGYTTSQRPEGALIWMHGASVGEAMSMLPLIAALQDARADAHVLITTGTVTSARRIAPLLPPRAMHQFVPIDVAGAVQRFLDHWRPDLAIWIESELWPRLVWETSSRQIPMALVNSRLSERSAKSWKCAPGMFRALLGCFRMIRTQDAETVARLDSFDVSASFAGNLKALIPLPKIDQHSMDAARAEVGDRPVWLAASTHPEDERIVLDAHRLLRNGRARTRPLLILAPRHPERGPQVAAEIAHRGLSAARRSSGEVPGPATDVWLTDTLGEMDLWYSLSQVTLVCGSFGQRGGHTPFEPVMAGSAVLHGPDVANFAPAYAALNAADGARMVPSSESIAAQVQALFDDPSERSRMASAAREAHDQLKPDLAALTHDLVGLIGSSR